MDSSLERIRAKIKELEEKIVSLRIAEHELLDFEEPQAAKITSAPKTARAPKAAKTKPVKTKPVDTEAEKVPGQTIGAAITDVLKEHGSLSASRISEQVAASGRDISNRAVSFALQAMKKRGLAKNTGGEWALAKARVRRG